MEIERISAGKCAKAAVFEALNIWKRLVSFNTVNLPIFTTDEVSDEDAFGDTKSS